MPRSIHSGKSTTQRIAYGWVQFCMWIFLRIFSARANTFVVYILVCHIYPNQTYRQLGRRQAAQTCALVPLIYAYAFGFRSYELRKHAKLCPFSKYLYTHYAKPSTLLLCHTLAVDPTKWQKNNINTQSTQTKTMPWGWVDPQQKSPWFEIGWKTCFLDERRFVLLYLSYSAVELCHCFCSLVVSGAQFSHFFFSL